MILLFCDKCIQILIACCVFVFKYLSCAVFLFVLKIPAVQLRSLCALILCNSTLNLTELFLDHGVISDSYLVIFRIFTVRSEPSFTLSDAPILRPDSYLVIFRLLSLYQFICLFDRTYLLRYQAHKFSIWLYVPILCSYCTHQF